MRETVVERLMRAYPGFIAGVKDSSGNWDYVTALLRFAPDLSVISGAEPLLPRLLAAGGCGVISGLSNLVPSAMRRLYDDPTDESFQAGIEIAVDAIIQRPIVPALRSIMGILHGSPSWRIPRPPLVELDSAAESNLFAVFDRAAKHLGAALTSAGLARAE